MEERTRAYLRGRFRDYYRRTELSLPPAADRREWGFIPWTVGPGTTMVRHRSLLDVGDVGSFLVRKRPRHVYFSAGRYDDPGAGSMNRKGWRGSDLVFDIDADHLPGVDPEADAYGDMLAAGKDALYKLLSFLEDDFGFEDLTIVFSGGRGYHVHVRDDGVRGLDREERREIVDYVRGAGVSLGSVTTHELVSGIGLKNPAEKEHLHTGGGWGRRAHQRTMAFVDDLRELPEDEAKDRVMEIEGFGPKTADRLVTQARENYAEFERGNLEAAGSATKKLASLFLDEAIEAENAPIDEPVTTDINRLIRLPGSLHGGSGLIVSRIERDDLQEFRPLRDAVPETFRGQEIRVDVSEGGEIELGGDSFTVPDGAQSLPEYVGVFLMVNDRAEKEKE